MQYLLSIMRPLAKKGLIEKYKKARLANYNAITILFLTLDHNLFNILYHCTLLLLYHSFWQSFCMKKRKHSSPFCVIVLKTFAAYPILDISKPGYVHNRMNSLKIKNVSLRCKYVLHLKVQVFFTETFAKIDQLIYLLNIIFMYYKASDMK